MELRNVTPADAGQIAAIYNHYVLNTVVSMEHQAVTRDDMANRIADVLASGFPWLVLHDGGEIAGYAYATPWRTRFGYRHSVESTVYLSQAWQRRGLGSRLYEALLERLNAAGYHSVIGGIALPNDGSVALHEKFGFAKVAQFREVGHKFDRWVDVGYWQLTLTPA